MEDFTQPMTAQRRRPSLLVFHEQNALSTVSVEGTVADVMEDMEILLAEGLKELAERWLPDQEELHPGISTECLLQVRPLSIHIEAGRGFGIGDRYQNPQR